MRSAAREVVFKYIFSRNFNGEDPALYRSLCEEFKLKGDSKIFADKLLKTVISHNDEILKEIESLVVGYKLDRIYNADRCLLVMAIAELKYMDTPVAVVIDEAVVLAGTYSTDQSVDFVNGVLAKYAADLKCTK